MVMGALRQETQLAVIGAGPGGYVAAIRAADLGQEVLLIEERDRPGGVCLLEGCIPSKALISVVELLESARSAKKFGLDFGSPKIDLAALREFEHSVVDGLSKGVASLLKQRGVEIIKGRARFESIHSLAVEGGDIAGVDFKNCIIATGSRNQPLVAARGLTLWSSNEALALSGIPKRLVVVGGGYIGLELGLAYAGLGSNVSVLELFPRLLMGADADLVEVMVKSATPRFEAIWLDSKVERVEKTDSGFAVHFDHFGKQQTIEADQVLVAVGRQPNTDNLGLELTGITLDQQGRLPVDEQGRTAVPNIFAIGDVTPGPMLAHKASREAKVAAEVIAGHKSAFDNRSIPAVVYTDPEIAWTGLTEQEANARNIKVNIGKFPLKALGRARTLGRTDGLVKILSDPDSQRVLGLGIVGVHASELIAEGSLAVEMGATLEDLLVTIHPHPTLSESIMEAAEAAVGASVHLPAMKRN